ncbi:unnamed protein product (macronuclear) [Paramecium tetraurelia]|uniref:Origin recognition complex subunit 1 n=1 Tax=Paramecium tetraurelia TaxID=5888 RepID=A0DNY1_PARTE|nr:uncharacterized protein GSPATT00018944001 [Paramecium tetraurelia]CAK84748.1 unnamed protein product [Paramecium tetraurelia]|eukprot:XP_001452145.1 hypothetical protein (macronuclear) [Paramecium tetraurelia strain d4-2]
MPSRRRTKKKNKRTNKQQKSIQVEKQKPAKIDYQPKPATRAQSKTKEQKENQNVQESVKQTKGHIDKPHNKEQHPNSQNEKGIPASSTLTHQQECSDQISQISQLFTLQKSEAPNKNSRQLSKPKILSIRAAKLTIPAETKEIQMDVEQEECEFINQAMIQTRCNLLGMPKQSKSKKDHSLTTENNFAFDPSEQSANIQAPRPHKTKEQLALMEECFTSLLESTIPDEILCRDQEKILITRFIEDGIKNNGQKQALYISGVPGIGKTATVLEVKNKLLSKKLNFEFIYFNAMNVGAPEDIYPFLYEKFTNKRETSRIKSCILLTELFNGESETIKQNKVVLLDECDHLYTTDQQVLYNLVDWPQQPSAHLIIIMIANTMDFPERLKPKLQSRLGNHRIVFKPYNSTQIESILQQRMKTKKIKQLFASNTLNYLGKKIATISTDIRKTLSVCRTAIVLAKEQLLKKGVFSQIEVDHIKLAYDIIYNKPQHNSLQHFNDELKLLLIMIALETHIKGYNYAYFHQVIQRVNQQKQLQKKDTLSNFQMKQVLIKLSQLNLVEIKDEQVLLTKSSWQQKLQVNIHCYFIQNSLDKDRLFNLEDVLIQLKINIDDIKNGLSNDDLFKEFSNLF